MTNRSNEVKLEEVSEEYKRHDSKAILPIRADKGSVGYDLYALEDVVIKGNKVKDLNNSLRVVYDSKVFWTDVKAFMPEDTCFLIEVRSSIGIRKHLNLKNSTGVIDSSYYYNNETGGNIAITLVNYSHEDVVIEKGSRIAQGLFVKVSTLENTGGQEEFLHKTRTGGTGSSGK